MRMNYFVLIVHYKLINHYLILIDMVFELVLEFNRESIRLINDNINFGEIYNCKIYNKS